MSSLFIIGNGFDMAHGIPTAYKEFRNWILEQYPDSLVFRETTMSIEEYGQLRIDEFAAETLVYAMDHASGEDWHDFEDALSRINFYHKLPGPTEEEHNEYDPDHDRKMGQYLLRMSAFSNGIIKSAEECWPVFFSEWIKSVEEKIENGAYSPKPSLTELLSDPTAKVLSFNYTKTLQLLYGIRVVKHIHNRVGQKLIFGHGDDRAEYNEPYDENWREPVGASTLNEFIQFLRKDTGKQLRKYNDFFRKLGPEIDKVYSYGFSYSKVDSPYIKEVVCRISPEAIWYFTAHEARNTKEYGKKKTKLRRYGFKGEFEVFEG